jgi:flagellar motor switch protein FliM
MEEILNQGETDVLLDAARQAPGTKGERQDAPHSIVPFVFGQGRQISAEQISSLQRLHETVARSLSQCLSASLPEVSDVTLVGVRQLPCTEFLQEIGERSYLASIQVRPLEVTGIFELDLATAYLIIDLLLGGDGKATPPERDLTEMEAVIIQSVVQAIFQELQGVWQSLVSLNFDFGGRLERAEVSRLLPAHERILAIGFEVQVPDRRGTLTFGLPAAVSSALLRKLSEQSLTPRRQVAPGRVAAWQHRLEECRLALEMRLPEVSVAAQDLLRLQAGQTLMLKHRVDEPVVVTVANQEMFTAYPVRARNMRGGMIRAELPLPDQEAPVIPA